MNVKCFEEEGLVTGAILESILNPNRAIDANYVSYTVVTKAGKVHTGIIQSDNGSELVLKKPKDMSVRIPRREIDTLQSNGVSLMPVGFEKTISVEQMSDLIAFLRDWRFLQDRVPLARE